MVDRLIITPDIPSHHNNHHHCLYGGLELKNIHNKIKRIFYGPFPKREMTFQVGGGVGTFLVDCTICLEKGDTNGDLMVEKLISPVGDELDGTCASCLCEKKLVLLSVQYDGVNGVSINVYANKDHKDFLQTFSNVDSGTVLSISGATLKDGKLKSNTYFEIQGSGSPDIIIHTSCSRHIVGKWYGDFLVVSHTDENGNTCP